MPASGDGAGAEPDALTRSHLVWESTEVLPGLDYRAELDELRFAVERLRLRDKGDIPAILGVASVLNHTGASSVCRSLATVLASNPDTTVCLVDLNRWSWDLNSEDRPGVADLVLGTASLEDVLVPTANPRLQYVTLGQVDDGDVAMLQRSRALEGFLDRLGASFSNVLLELPPLLTASEALAFVSHCEACAVVVEQGVTSRAELREALDSLGDVRVLGVILNEVETKVPGFLLRLFTG